MITLTTTKAKLLFVEVPGLARDFKIFDDELPYISYFIRHETRRIYLPFGSTYTFLFTTKQATEEDWKPLVDEKNIVCPEYGSKRKLWVDYVSGKTCGSAASSGLSLQKANGMDVNKNYAVIEID